MLSAGLQGLLQSFLSARVSSCAHLRSPASGSNAHLDPVFQSIVDKRNEVAFLHNAIDGYGRRVRFLAGLNLGPSYRDVVVGFAIPVTQRELVPLRGQARRE